VGGERGRLSSPTFMFARCRAYGMGDATHVSAVWIPMAVCVRGCVRVCVCARVGVRVGVKARVRAKEARARPIVSSDAELNEGG
jgi:hypothetical protein